MYPGIEYNNNRIAAFTNLNEYEKDNIPRNIPRLPWQDIALKVKGKVVADLCNHFVEYWNFVNTEEVVMEDYCEDDELDKLLKEHHKILQE